MRRAYTLPELMLVIAVIGIVVGIALPQLSRAVDRIEVDAAAGRVIAAHRRARIMAITRSQVLVLSIDSSQLAISPRGGDTILWSEVGPVASHVALVGPSRRFTFSPEGLTLGLSNATLQLVRGASTRTVVVSRLGRIRVTR
jgi:prepilin-type N-terminal cleavage/methylation domain-containing protein